MERLTTNKDVSEMGMYELAHNSCYIKDGVARYRDFEMDMDARDFARKLMVQYGHWKSCEEYGLDADNELVDNDIFDETMIENLIYETSEDIGLIALFYRNLWAMADLREKLKEYEDLEEQGSLLKLPCKVGDTVYEVQQLRKRIQPYTIISIHISGCSVLFGWEVKDGKGIYSNVNGFCDYAIGKTVFLTQAEAEEALKKMNETEE